MTTRQEAAEETVRAITSRDDVSLIGYGKVCFLAGCEYADGEHREFYGLVGRFIHLTDIAIMHTPESKELDEIDKKIREHLASFTEREQPKD